jgi:hypothetical protein
MPRGDRTGPSGQGTGTGRTLGICYGFDTPGYTKAAGGGMGIGFGFGGGRGRGRGRGYGWGRSFGAANVELLPGYPWMSSISKEDEVKMLKSQADALRRSQKEVEKRLGELEKEAE